MKIVTGKKGAKTRLTKKQRKKKKKKNEKKKIETKEFKVFERCTRETVLRVQEKSKRSFLATSDKIETPQVFVATGSHEKGNGRMKTMKCERRERKCVTMDDNPGV